MNRLQLSVILGAMAAIGFAETVPLTFPAAESGTVTQNPTGDKELVHSLSEPVALAAGGLYGFSYSGREVGNGLLLAGSQDVNVDRHCPDQSWYDFSNVFQVQGEGGAPRREKFHFGNYRGKGEFSFRNWRLVSVKAEYLTANGLTLGHGEALVANRYTFDTSMAGFARNAARPLKVYRGTSFNSNHWNVGPNSEIVYRHELQGRRLLSGDVSFTSAHNTGKEGMQVEASRDDGATWVPVGVVTNKGSTELTLDKTLFPTAQLLVRLRGVKGTSLQISQYSFAAEVDGAPAICYGGTIYRDADTGAVFGEVKPPVFAERIADANAQLITTANGADVWGAVADVKVFRGTPVPTVRAQGLSLALAANERESVQLVVTAGAQPLTDVRAVAGALTAANGKDVIAADCVSVRRVGYVAVKTPTDETGACGLWPDPLLPQDASPFGVKARENQPLWVTVSVPKRTSAGIYSGSVELSLTTGSAAPVLTKIPLTVEVYDFALPDRLTCETAYGFSPRRVAEFHRVKPGSPEHDQMLEKYLELFADYRLTVYHWGKGEMPQLTWRNAADPAKATPVFNWLEYDDAITEMRGRFDHTALRVGVEGLGHGFQKGFSPGKICGVSQTNDWYQPLMGRYLGALEAHLKEKGWLKSSYVYWFDEPNPGVLGHVLEGMLTLKRHAPGLRRMLTYPATKSLWEGVNLWNPRLDGFYKNDSEETRAQKQGDFWWYICCGPRAPYPTEFIDHAGDELRAWLWMTWDKGVKGTLVWETSVWTSTSRYPDKMHPQNPYEDAMAWSTSGGTWGNGDGRFVYPPARACYTPRAEKQEPIMDAPNPSYRLAILRDGLEDYEYFAQLKRVDPKNPLLKVPASVYRRLDDFNADPSAMREHRAKLAQEIVRLKGGVKRLPPVTCVPAWNDGAASSYRVDKWRKIRHEAKMAEIAAHGGRPYDLVMLGDSVTELWEWKAPRWGTNELVKLNAKLDTLALGYGGDGIQQVLWRVENGELDGYEAKHVAVMIGTNNKGCKPWEMAEGVKKLLAAIRQKQPKAKIALYATFPCRQTWRNLRNQSANKLYAALADGKHVFFRDINADLPLTLFPDGLHPNEEGYAIWRADLERFCGVSDAVRLVQLPEGVSREAERAAIAEAEARYPGERLVYWGKAQRWGVPTQNVCFTPEEKDARAAAELLAGKSEQPGARAAAAASLADVPEVVYVVRDTYPNDHHNTATIFQCGEINDKRYTSQGALKAWNPKTGQTRVIVPEKKGRTVRDPEVSYDGKRIVFAMRDGASDDYHIYVVDADGANLRQLTRAKGVSDIDPAFLPDGGIVFTSTRDPKYCMCNRHIMGNLYRMEADGANIHQIGKSTLFEGHSAILPDGRILYDRWEYVDRDFGDAQGLWTCNPDGTAHAIYWGNNTTSPGGVVNARPLGDGSKAIAVFASCHDRPWGALGIVDRALGVDGRASVVRTWPASFIDRVHAEGQDFDSTRLLPVKYADPMPIDDAHFLAVRQNGRGRGGMSLVYLDLDGNETELLSECPAIHTPVLLRPRRAPAAIPCRRTYEAPHAPGAFYVQNVYVGTHMKDVAPGSVKAIRVVESPEKRDWTPSEGWFGHGEEAPAMNWHSFENKRILGTVPVEEDGSAYFEVPGNTFVYFQALDAEGKMVQSMRSGVIVQPGEKYGCVGCHEKRVGEAAPVSERAAALRRAPSKLDGSWNLAGLGRGTPKMFSFQRDVQPVFTKNCLSCHDYGGKAAAKLNLSGDRGAFFATSYVDLWSQGFVTCAGGGPAEIFPAFSWGSHASKLTKKLYGHGRVQLTDEERARVIVWMDLNGIYYPTYSSAYPANLGGRLPLTKAEKDELEKLTGGKIENNHGRRQREQLNFDRPEQSRILAMAAGEKKEQALAIIRKGAVRLAAQGRGDVEEDFEPCAADQARIRRLAKREAEEERVYAAIRENQKVYDE
ncbi:MAG: DUF4091 domain-containing protein [Kiritimatiellae bacterium]|nr:DUF4091 domain-containing protein [Kiritimatiellia bacterium]